MYLIAIIVIAIIGAVESACNQIMCSDIDDDCWAGAIIDVNGTINVTVDPCTCSGGYEARETGETAAIWVNEAGEYLEHFEFECCDPGTGGHRDGTCGLGTDENGCTQTKCTSDMEEGEGDCYAGTRWEGCTCSDGWTAVETGNAGPGSHGHANYEYTCCPSGGTTDGTCGDFVRHSDEDCNQDSCSDFEEDCWAGYNHFGIWDKCTCHDGLEASETGETVHVWVEEIGDTLELFEYVCCDVATREGARSDGTCGNYETDVNGCTQEKCAHGWCWGGTSLLGCFCDDGWGAVETGNVHWDTWHEYTCCPNGGTTDGTCNEFDPYACNQDSCADMDGDCRVAFDHSKILDKCICNDGREARWTLDSRENIHDNAEIEEYEFECCDVGTALAHSDGTCGNDETDENGCTQTKCSSRVNFDDISPDDVNCWAGTVWMGCTCDDGWTAIETGISRVADDGEVYYEYTCCPSGGSTDGTCGDFVRHSDEHCNQDSCADWLEDCWSGYEFISGYYDLCRCYDGLEVRSTGQSEMVGSLEMFEFECCDPGTEGTHQDHMCWYHGAGLGDDPTILCTHSTCTSDDDEGGVDCYAGTRWEGGTCWDGWSAVETGNSGPGSHGHANYEYRCCASGGTTDGTCGDFVRHSDDVCEQDSCSNNKESCWAGVDNLATRDKCTCNPGREAREPGEKVMQFDEFGGTVELFEYECCDYGTMGAHSDGTCGNYETDDNGCTQTKCMSPNNTAGGHCWAGTRSSGCWCDDGWTAVETGKSFGPAADGNHYHEYTCCPSGGTTDGSCYDFDPACNQDDCSDIGGDCRAGFNNGGTWDACTCHNGLEAREVRQRYAWEVPSYHVNGIEDYEFECCDVGTPTAHSDGTCFDLVTDEDGCTQTKCISGRSPIRWNHEERSCWAGTIWNGCLCDDDWTAVETGISRISDNGEAYYEYTCCPSGGSTDGTCGDFVRHSDESVCNQDSCADHHRDCWAGYDIWDECACHNGLDARETGRSVIVDSVELFEFECCDPGTDGAHSDGTCGHYLTDENGCTQAKCSSRRSPIGWDQDGVSCWAGTVWLGCTCDDGWTAVQTGTSRIGDDGEKYYEFTCCPGGTPENIAWSSTDGTCGQFERFTETGCNRDSCADYDENCWAGYDVYPPLLMWDECICHDGLHARETGRSVIVDSVELVEFECCEPGTGGHRDGTCGNHETDANGCTQTKCTSDTRDEEGHCYAGTKWEGCTCDDGWTAVETGNVGPGFHGHPNYEYTCCPSGGTTNGTCGDFVHRYSEDCNQDSCANMGEHWNCWAGTEAEDRCMCHDGLEARETGESVQNVWNDDIVDDTSKMVELFEFECCEKGTRGAHSDGTCGNYETDHDGCTQTKCRSPDNTTGGHCWAGTKTSGCFCDDGWAAVENWGPEHFQDGKLYRDYTCCPIGSGRGTTDGSCYDFDPACNQDACADMDEDCWAGFNNGGTWDECTCHDGLDARETGESEWIWVEETSKYVEVFEFQCCDPGTEGAHRDGTCGDYTTDENGCTQKKCTSRFGDSPNCYAGTRLEGCTCSDGWTAVETGNAGPHDFLGLVTYEYTCCPSGGTTDGTCGDFFRRYSENCHQDSCLELLDNNEDCVPWGGFNDGDDEWNACRCGDGLEARETGDSIFVDSEGEILEIFEYECCTPGTGGAHSDGTCGNYETDEKGCSQTKCTSPANTPGGD